MFRQVRFLTFRPYPPRLHSAQSRTARPAQPAAEGSSSTASADARAGFTVEAVGMESGGGAHDQWEGVGLEGVVILESGVGIVVQGADWWKNDMGSILMLSVSL